jgi:ankyrin repeat protein
MAFSDGAALLLRAGADLKKADSSGKTPLHRADQEGLAKALRLLVAAEADVEQRYRMGFSALHMAAAFGHADVVRSLLDAGASIDQRSENTPGVSAMAALHVAAASWHEEVVKVSWLRMQLSMFPKRRTAMRSTSLPTRGMQAWWVFFWQLGRM